MNPTTVETFADLERAVALKDKARTLDLRNRSVAPDPECPPTFCDRWDDCKLGYGHSGVCFGLSRRWEV